MINGFARKAFLLNSSRKTIRVNIQSTPQNVRFSFLYFWRLCFLKWGAEPAKLEDFNRWTRTRKDTVSSAHEDLFAIEEYSELLSYCSTDAISHQSCELLAAELGPISSERRNRCICDRRSTHRTHPNYPRQTRYGRTSSRRKCSDSELQNCESE